MIICPRSRAIIPIQSHAELKTEANKVVLRTRSLKRLCSRCLKVAATRILSWVCIVNRLQTGDNRCPPSFSRLRGLCLFRTVLTIFQQQGKIITAHIKIGLSLHDNRDLNKRPFSHQVLVNLVPILIQFLLSMG